MVETEKNDGSGDKKIKSKSKTAKKNSVDRENSKEKNSSSVSHKRGVGKELLVKPKVNAPPEQAIKVFGPLNVDAKQAQTAILVLQSKESHVVIEALNCLQKFCKKQIDNRDLVVTLGGVPEIIKLIFSKNQIIQRLSMKLLSLVSINHQAKLLLSTSDLCRNLITLAQSADPVIQEYSTFCMSSVSTLYIGRLEMIQEGGIPVLLGLLDNPDPDIQNNSGETIYRILHEPVNAELFTTSSIIERIFKLCESSFPALQQIGLAILAEIATSHVGVQVLEEVNVITKIGEKLQHMEFDDLHQHCLRILVRMASSKTSCQHMQSILFYLCTYFRKGKDVPGRILCLQLIGKLAKLPLISKVLVEGGVTQWITAVIACNNITKMREAAIFAASQIAMTNMRAKIRFSGCIKQILFLLTTLSDITTKFKEYALLFLSTALEDRKRCCPKFIKHNGVAFLAGAIGSEMFSISCRISIMNCIACLSRFIEYQILVVDANIVPKILHCLDVAQNPNLLTAACNALCGLLTREKARLEFLENKGSEILIKMVLHKEFNVVTSAVPIILAFGAYPTIGKELVERGILHALWKRQDLISVNGPLRTAFECILGSHLPSKFAVAGHIDPFEKLENGFYDSGNLKKVDNFVTLKNMTVNDVVHSDTRVLYLNLTTSIDPSLLEQNPILQVAATENQSVMNIIDELRPLASELKSEKDFVRLIAVTVAEKMGGMLDKWRIGAQSEDLEMADIQSKHESIVVPITMLTMGAHRPRAILFKAIADAFGIPCSLDRGDYKKSWNVLLINSKRRQKLCPCAGESGENIVYIENLRRYVVDLIHHPGALLPLNSYEANAYCFF